MNEKNVPGGTPESSKRKLSILHLEDDSNDAELVSHALKNAGADVAVTVARDRDQFLAAMAGSVFDVILSDNKVPGFGGAEALEMAREKCSEVPFIFVCGSACEAEAREQALHAGAADWVSKSKLKELAEAILKAVRNSRESRGSRI